MMQRQAAAPGCVSNVLKPGSAARSVRARAVAEPPGKAVDKLKSQISNQDLIQTTPNIGSNWAEHSGETYQVINPATEEVIAEMCKCGGENATKAIDRAEAALPGWRKATAHRRSELLLAWKAQIEKNTEDIAKIMTMECGKPLHEAKMEISAGCQALEWMAGEAVRVYGQVLQPTGPDRQQLTIKQPVGVVGAITPWNFPMAMITRKCAPALAAGCTIVLKPSEQTPLSGYALMKLAQEAGLPDGVLNIVSGDAKDIGEAILSSHKVRKIGFTGSTRAGKYLMERAAATVKRVSMELGGNAPFIVFDDANLEAAADAVVGSGFMNSGQVCIAANRVLVHESVHDKFADVLADRVKGIRQGNGLDSNTDMGPCINQSQADFAQTHVDDAVSKGAKVIAGGSKPKDFDAGYFYSPTLLGNANPDMRVFREETFAPVMPMFTFKSDEEALKLANDTDYGLAAYFFSRDIKRVWEVASELEYGMIGVNEVSIEEAPAPFGGIKQSGLGRENGPSGIHEFLEEKYILMGLNG